MWQAIALRRGNAAAGEAQQSLFADLTWASKQLPSSHLVCAAPPPPCTARLHTPQHQGKAKGGMRSNVPMDPSGTHKMAAGSYGAPDLRPDATGAGFNKGDVDSGGAGWMGLGVGGRQRACPLLCVAGVQENGETNAC